MTSPSAETLRRVLLLEQSQGYQDHAVMGGLATLLHNWRAVEGQAEQATRMASLHKALAALDGYGSMPHTERQQAVERALALLADPPPGSRTTTPRRTDAAAVEKRQAATRSPDTHRKAAPAQPRHRTAERSRVALSDSVTSLRGVGAASAERMAMLGILTVGDLLYHLPRRYQDLSHHKKIRELAFGDEVTVTGTIRSTRLRRTGGKSIFSATLADETGLIECTWFNQPYLARNLTEGLSVAVSGQVGEFRGRLVFSSPDWEPLAGEPLHTGRIVPIYPLTEGLHARGLRRLMNDALEATAGQIDDPLPQRVIAANGLIGLAAALQQIHLPASMAEAEQARERLAFDELLLLQLGIMLRRNEWRREPGVAMHVDGRAIEHFVGGLPFPLTETQQRAIEQILQDLSRPVPMSRLLQGDVGSGKTVVAVAAMLAVVSAGYQAALMAPTSILAQQHAESVQRLLAGRPDIRVALLEGSQSAAEKARVHQDLADGQIDIVIGTHTLIQEGFEFARLGLVIVDEQHRFGVAQRESLRARNAAFRPHMLAMSATPIPRTLALTIYGDLDVSVLDELPPGRQPVLTAVRTQSSREAVYRFVRSELERGHQAYIICPLVEESEQIDARAAVEEHARLSTDIFPQFRLGLLHGRLSAEEKESVMRRFKEGEYDILVSTAVVEVGVDVANATVMLVEGAERFGLAQLHQFRGRVGRGTERSYCILLSDSATDTGLERLETMAQTSDGFALAEKDLELRGPGDFWGLRQHGLPELKVAQLSDRRTLEKARGEALRIFEEDPLLLHPEHQALARKVSAFWSPVSRS